MGSIARWHRDEWMWMVRNGIAVLAAVVLAGILSEARVFQEAALGSGGFNAAAAVRLLGYGIALALIWITAWRAAAQIAPRDAVSRLLHEGLLFHDSGRGGDRLRKSVHTAGLCQRPPGDVVVRDRGHVNGVGSAHRVFVPQGTLHLDEAIRDRADRSWQLLTQIKLRHY